MKKFVVYVEESNTRDIQIYNGEDWWDFTGDVILAVVKAQDGLEALNIVCNRFNVIDKDSLGYYEIIN